MPAILFLGAFAVIMGVVSLFALWTDRTLEFWLTYFKGDVIDVPFWISFLATLLLNVVVLVVNVISEVIRLAV
jgi:hypothetical protein